MAGSGRFEMLALLAAKWQSGVIFVPGLLYVLAPALIAAVAMPMRVYAWDTGEQPVGRVHRTGRLFIFRESSGRLARSSWPWR